MRRTVKEALREDTEMAKLPFGIRHNNPGNIIHTNAVWQGLDNPSFTVNPLSGIEFCRFKAPEYGIRAIAVLLKTYFDKRQAEDGTPIDTIEEICARYEPNKAGPYAQHMAQDTGIPARAPIDIHDWSTMRKIVLAIVRMENGMQPYSDAEVNRGLLLAGMEQSPAEAKPLSKSRTIKGSIVAGVTTVVAGIQEQAPEISGQAMSVLDMVRGLPIPRWLFLAVVLAGVAWIVYARIDDRKKGLR